MNTLILSLSLSLALLLSLALVSLYNVKVVKPALEALNLTLTQVTQLETQRHSLLTQALNLLSSKDPIAYQMVQAATPEPMRTGVYNGPYITGEEYQLLTNEEARLSALWAQAEEGQE